MGLTWGFWSRFCTSPCEKPLWESCGKLLGTFAWTCIGPCENLFTSSGVFGWNPPKPLRTFIQGLVRRSCGNPLHLFFLYEVFALKCWESSALAFVWQFYLWCSEAVRLKRSGKYPCKNVHKSPAVAIMSNLICYCSMVTVACIWYTDFLPPTLFGLFFALLFFFQKFGTSPISHGLVCLSAWWGQGLLTRLIPPKKNSRWHVLSDYIMAGTADKIDLQLAATCV